MKLKRVNFPRKYLSPLWEISLALKSKVSKKLKIDLDIEYKELRTGDIVELKSGDLSITIKTIKLGIFSDTRSVARIRPTILWRIRITVKNLDQIQFEEEIRAPISISNPDNKQVREAVLNGLRPRGLSTFRAANTEKNILKNILSTIASVSRQAA